MNLAAFSRGVNGRVAAVCAIILFSLIVPASMRGQGAATYAAVSGDVSDRNGGVLPGAMVTITNRDSGLSQTTTTDGTGHFTFLRLLVGRYNLTVELASFKKAEVNDLELTIGETRNLKIEMQVGTVQEKVEVTAETATVATTESEVGNTISPTQVTELPLNQRSFTALVTQQPGLVVMSNATPPTVLGAATNTGSYISGNGLMGTSVAYLVDGVNISNGSFTAPGTAAAGDMPGVEAIQEFQVLTHNYSAAYGGASAAVVSFATRTGTNKFHGNVYDFVRNDIFDARAFFDQQKPPFRRNQFGGSLGGPIFKDKTFFFLNYEALRQRLTTTSVAAVPDVCSRNSGLGGSGVGCPGGVPGVVTGVVSTMPYMRGPVAISPAIQAILTLYPLPSPNGRNLGGGVAQAFFTFPQPTNQQFGIVNVTHQLTSKDSISARYAITDANARSFFNLPTFAFTRDDRDQNVLLKWTRTISAHVVNTVSFSFVRNFVTADTNSVQSLAPLQFTGNPARKTIGVMTVGAGTAGTTSGTLTELGNDDASPFTLGKNVFPLNDDATWVIGKHTLKFGGLVNWYQWNWSSATITGGSYTFLSLNDLLAGNPAVFLIHRDGPDSSYMLRTTQIGWYVEDSWRTTKRLTLTAGLRHDFQVPVLKDKLNHLGNWQSPTDTSIHVGEPYNNYSLTQFQPRLGLAWDPFGNGKSVVRAGFGVFNDFVDFSGNGQGQLQWNAPQPVLNTSFGDPFAPGFLPVIPFPTCSGCTVPSPFVGLVTGVLTPMNSPTSIQWSLEAEREIGAGFSLTLGYSGSNSYHIPRKLESAYNLPCGTDSTTGLPIFPPACAAVGTGAPGVAAIGFSLYSKRFDAVANYHAFSVQVSRRLLGGLSLQSGYTFAKALSESDAVNSGNVIVGVSQASQDPGLRHLDRSESLFSIRHRFTENLIYDLPFGKGQKWMSNPNGLAQAVLGGWQITSLGTFQSGFPFSVLAGVGITGVGDAIDFPDRPLILSSHTVNGGVNNYLNLSAYALQAPGHLGTAPRNSARGPNFNQLDFGVGKLFDITERINLKFRADIFNLLNHPNFGLPGNRIYQGGAQPPGPQPCNLTPAQAMSFSCNPGAGVISSTVGTPREVQFSLKLSF